MSSQDFDPNIFLDQSTETASQRREPIMPADYKSIIEKVEVKPWVSKKDSTKSGFSAYVTHLLEIPSEEAQRVGLSENQLRLTNSAFLDTVPGNPRALDWSKGKNNAIRRYREATGQNQDGLPFFLNQLVGKICTVKVGHEVWEGNPIEKITGVAPRPKE